MDPTRVPRTIEAGNAGDGAPLVLGDPAQLGAVFLESGSVHVLDFDGDGRVELVDSGNGVAVYRFVDAMADDTPVVDRGRRLGAMSRSHQRDEADDGLCGTVLAAGDFDGDGEDEVILGPRPYSKRPVVMAPVSRLRQKSADDAPALTVSGGPAGGGDGWWAGARLGVFDWDGDGRLDLIAARSVGEGYYVPPGGSVCPEDQRDRYHRDGRWKGQLPRWELHLLKNAGDGIRFVYAGPVELASPPPGGPLCAVDAADPTAGLLLLDYDGNLHHLALQRPGPTPVWGALTELTSLHGAPFCRHATFYTVHTARLRDDGPDLFAGDVSSNVGWCRFRGRDRHGRPVYDDPRKVAQADPHVNGGFFSVPTAGDWRATGTPDLLVGSIEGYVFWYRTLSTDPLRFAPPERVRVGDEEIRRYAKPDPAGGHHWGSSQGPGDGFHGGYSNPVLVDWTGDGRLDLLMADMIGLFEVYPNRGTPQQPRLAPPLRLHVDGEPVFGPWRVQPGAGDLTGSGRPELVAMDLDLDLVLYRRAAGDDPTNLLPPEKLRFEDGDPIRTTGVYTPQGGDGRGRTKIQLVDFDGDGRLDLLLGVGPQYRSAFRASFVLLCRNVGNAQEPRFARPVPLLFDDDGSPLEFWRHCAHPCAVDFDGDGRWELVVGADLGHVWYYRPEAFGEARGAVDLYRPDDDESL